MDNIYEKQEWLLEYINKNYVVDMLNEQFVEDYIKAFNPNHKFMLIGAHKCRELSELLKSLYDQGILNRNAIGIQNGECYMPKWIYCYTLTQLGKDMV